MKVAEDFGFDTVWLAEIHFQKDRSVLAASLIVASALAACTQRVKIGIAVQVLPLSHPLRQAEDVATVEGKSPTSACSAGRWSGSSARGGGLQGAQDTRLGGVGGPCGAPPRHQSQRRGGERTSPRGVQSSAERAPASRCRPC